MKYIFYNPFNSDDSPELTKDAAFRPEPHDDAEIGLAGLS